MKKLLNFLFALLPLFAFSQSVEGEVTYEEVIQLKIHLEGMEDDEMMAMLPKEQAAKKTLYFSPDASLYKDAESDEDENQEISGGSGEMHFKMIIARPDNKLYKDLQEEQKIEQREFMGKVFLIKDELKSYEWKLTGEQKQIGEYICQKATMADSVTKTEVWFTPQIPVSTGPGNLGRLPGLILEVSINDGEQTIVAKEVKIGKVESDLMAAPSKGREVTQAEFEEIMKEKMKEMEAEMGGSGSGGGTTIKFIQRRN
ncbi:MAG: GLPGLI family protein [Bacteroidia bacterium]